MPWLPIMASRDFCWRLLSSWIRRDTSDSMVASAASSPLAGFPQCPDDPELPQLPRQHEEVFGGFDLSLQTSH